ncbi:hypothetical protein BCR32DRAFT_268623 [Anaeromyces robustus]|uniref:Autophagy-related protein 27 n=1 Tax=Anaeromyces robustus TaxID=1754192 RepID=A0A1Y1WV14_9FUNG|nr:hypothetical protein BCR32DRAFT_270844 [Anaeromyces robustus]ORX80906.1 hypothetical protein BCR32DRAFT_268623 [Anaeromyces robustus]|eukprot:ORX77138.1 hypothetical protein BCR32DRAFT_270844 [Anaeromyces robustus]
MKLKNFNVVLLFSLIVTIKLVYSLDCMVERFNEDVLNNKINVIRHSRIKRRDGKSFPLFDCKYDRNIIYNGIKCRIKTRSAVVCNDYLTFYMDYMDWDREQRVKYRETCQCRTTNEVFLNIREVNENNEDNIIKTIDLRNIKNDTVLVFDYVFNNDEKCTLSLNVLSVQYNDCLKNPDIIIHIINTSILTIFGIVVKKINLDKSLYFLLFTILASISYSISSQIAEKTKFGETIFYKKN